MGHSRFTHRGDRTNQNLDDLSMKRSPAPQRNQDHDESLSLTPSTNDGKWHLTQKSFLGNHDNPSIPGNLGINTANNRTSGSDTNNPLNRITTNIP